MQKKPLFFVVWAEPCLADLITEIVSTNRIACSKISSWDKLKKVLSLSPKNVVVIIDTDQVMQHIEGLLSRIFKDRPGAEILVLRKPPMKLATRGSRPDLMITEDFMNAHVGHIRVWSAKQGTGEFIHYIKQLARTRRAGLTSDGDRILPASAHGPKPDNPMPPNKLARKIAGEMVLFSGSIHLNSSMLRDNFVQMLEAEAYRSVPFLDKDTLERWRNYATVFAVDSRRDHATETGPDYDACARFGRVIFAENRFTYLVLGDRGCGKTTFLTHFINNYLPSAYPDIAVESFVVDFLTYDFVQDAQTLVTSLEKAVFEAGCLSTNNSLPGEYSDYSEYVNSARYIPGELLRKNVPKDICFPDVSDFLSTILSALGDEELVALNRDVEALSNSPDIGSALAWKHSVLSTQPVPSVCLIVAHFAQKSQSKRTRVLADAVYNQARRRPRLHYLLKESGIDPLTRETPPGVTFEDAIQNFMANLAQCSQVILVVDNADRSIFSHVELQIFRTAWDYLPRGLQDKRVRIVFSMRTDTYYRHARSLASYGLDHGEDLRDIANIYSGIILEAPSFIRLAQVRLDTLKKQLQDKSDSESCDALTKYVGSVLNAKIAEPIFKALFGGDLRRNLELFEYAVASPHMVHADAYYFTETDGAPGEGVRDYVHQHRLLTSLMLGPWNTFRQRRSLVFLNVFNAQIQDWDGDGWRNTLLMPRILIFFDSHGRRDMSVRRILGVFCDALGYTEQQVLSALELLTKYRLLEHIVSSGGTSGRIFSGNYVRFTECGRFYVTSNDFPDNAGLMFRLEYLQAVYWDMEIPAKLYFKNFEKGVKVRDLDSFVVTFADMIAFEEEQEAEYWEQRDINEDVKSLLRVSISRRIHEVARAQVTKIYYRRSR